MAGTKKQKMDMSKAIVEAIYSKDPPGRFLKRFHDRLVAFPLCNAGVMASSLSIS